MHSSRSNLQSSCRSMQVDADYKALPATHCGKHLGQLLQALVGKPKLVCFRSGNMGGNAAPCRLPHPLMGYVGFDPKHIKWCSMHTLNLGILQHLNGSSIELLCQLGCLYWTALFLFDQISRYIAEVFLYPWNHDQPKASLGHLLWTTNCGCFQLGSNALLAWTAWSSSVIVFFWYD